MKRLLALGLVLWIGAAAIAAPRGFHPTIAPVPPTDCQAHVAYDRDMTLPGYLLPTAAGPATCIPFTTVSAHPAAGDSGDFYVDEFTDAKLRERWVACKADKVCYDRVYKQVIARHPPNKEYKLQDAHGRFLLGKIEEKGGETDRRASGGRATSPGRPTMKRLRRSMPIRMSWSSRLRSKRTSGCTRT